MSEKVFITGASGFIGSNLARRLVSEGYDVVALLRPGASHPFLEGLDITRVEGTLGDTGVIEGALKDVKHVFHLAAHVTFNRYEADESKKVNVEGTKNLLQAASKAGVKRFIYLSACAVLGFSSSGNELKDETASPDIDENSVYAYTKKLAEDEVRRAAAAGLDAVIANPCTVYGEGDKTLNSGTVIKSVYTGSIKLAPPGGTSFVAVGDLVDGLLLLMSKGRAGERYIFCSENMEYLNLFNKIARKLGVSGVKLKLPGIFRTPLVAAFRVLEIALNLVGKNPQLFTPQIINETFGYKYFDSTKAREELGWEPKLSLGDAVGKAFDFYKKEGLL